MTRRYLNPAWKNRSTEELERALEHLCWSPLADDPAIAEVIYLLAEELKFRTGVEA